MEVTFQNKREDFQAFHEYMVKETDQGKRISKQVFGTWLTWTVSNSLLFSFLMWGLFEKWQVGLVVGLFLFLIWTMAKLLSSRFKPIYHSGIQAYKNEEKFITPKQLQAFQLPRTITMDDKWLEIRSSEAVHQWRWRQVDQIGITPNFIFIHVGNCPVVYVPKRDFPSEQSFVEFGKNLVELKEKYKNQPIGAE
jgi:hypothetical protein